MRVRIVWKFFAAFVLLTIVTAIILSSFLVIRLGDNVESKISQRLQNNTILAGEIFKKAMLEGDNTYIQREAKNLAANLNLRITVIDKQGKVLADSERDARSMENHGDRTEFVQAVKKGVGESTRFSQTLNYPMKYVAVRVSDGEEVVGVVRIAVPESEVQLEMHEPYKTVMLGTAAAICIAAIIAYVMSCGISRPIRQMRRVAGAVAKGQFDNKAIVKSNDELGELAQSLNAMSDELKLKIERLKYLDTVRTDFVANVSHELKTPLTSIRGFVETLEDGAINDIDNARRFLAIIKKHTQRLGNIIDDLLRLSELESGGGIEMVEVDLKELIDEIVMGFGHSLAVKQQKLSAEAPSGDFTIRGDKDRLEQVFVNLIDNAIKYTKEGGKIKVQLAQTDDSVVVTVEDDGIGIPTEDVERVFERFYRVDKARSREIGGTGLGLSIAKHIVSAHNGGICIESEVNKGTKVLVTLPKK
ncbi:MAG: ATP-binding protein [Phycisphaerae bacterium]|nr:ATP-binding protein [Phycisphaerae bacterium]MDD5380717.1 ATP-binding protein [Phycisphaerae bacterium]